MKGIEATEKQVVHPFRMSQPIGKPFLIPRVAEIHNRQFGNGLVRLGDDDRRRRRLTNIGNEHAFDNQEDKNERQHADDEEIQFASRLGSLQLAAANILS